jgi:hypothetical protein
VWRVGLNDPFAGALLPSSRHRRDARVGAVMVGVNRRLYLHEADAAASADFEAVARRIRRSCVEAIACCGSWKARVREQAQRVAEATDPTHRTGYRFESDFHDEMLAEAARMRRIDTESSGVERFAVPAKDPPETGFHAHCFELFVNRRHHARMKVMRLT